MRASRREFIKGVIASGVAVSSAGYVVLGRGTAHAQAAGAVGRLVTLNVNGRDRPVDVLPNETLIHTIRYKLGLTGTKLGCDHSECGNCTVMIDDVATYSCSTLTHSVRGRKITTIEGIEGPNGELHKVQKPHCGPSSWIIAFWTGWSSPLGPSIPSMVTILRPRTLWVSVEQE